MPVFPRLYRITYSVGRVLELHSTQREARQKRVCAGHIHMTAPARVNFMPIGRANCNNVAGQSAKSAQKVVIFLDRWGHLFSICYRADYLYGSAYLAIAIVHCRNQVVRVILCRPLTPLRDKVALYSVYSLAGTNMEHSYEKDN